MKRLKSLLVQLIEYNILFTAKYDNVINQFRKFLEQDLKKYHLEFETFDQKFDELDDFCFLVIQIEIQIHKKLVNNRIVDHLEKCGIFSDFQYGFRSSGSTADLLTVVSDRIARAFNRSGATRAAALDISKAFDRVWHSGLLHKLNSYGISGQMFGLISSLLSNRWFRVVLGVITRISN